MKPWRQAIRLMLVALVPAILSGWLHPRHPEWSWTKTSVEQTELRDALNWKTPILWVDARNTEAFQQKHIPGAISLNESDWEELLPGFLAEWQPDKRVIVYCNTKECDASQAVARRLIRELKVTGIYVLKGGWLSWEQNHP